LFIGVSIILVYGYILADLFIRVKLRSQKDVLILDTNYAEMLDYDIAKTLIQYFPKPLRYIHIVKAITHSTRGKTILGYMGIDAKDFLNKVKHFDLDTDTQYAPLDEYWARAQYIQNKWEENRINANVLLYVLIEQGGGFITLLNQLDLSQEDFMNIIAWESLQYHNTISVHPWSPSGIQKSFGSLGRSWTLGYTNDLDAITEDITEKVLHRDAHRVVIHQQILRSILTSLSKSSRNNILLLGGIGVGKSSLVENLASTIRTYQLEHNEHLSRVLKLETTDLLSGIEHAPEYLLKALNYAEIGRAHV
jgi:ATP-dependent Clp protease ATP-binding subunit ClpA